MSLALALEDDPGIPPPDENPEQAAATQSDATAHDIAEGKLGLVPTLRRRVLIAEDNSALRESVNDILSAQGYVVLEAGDGQAALGILRGSPIDVLILDLAMPRVDGVELLRQIDPPPPVVIIYSAFEYYTAEAVQRQVGSKVFRSLRKPVLPVELIASIDSAIDELDRGNG